MPTDLSPDSRTARRRPLHQRQQGAVAFFFVTPFFVLFTVAMLVPIGYALYLSFFTEQRSGLGFGGNETVFTGLGNYAHVLSDPSFLAGFKNLLLYCVMYIPVMVGLAVVFALLLDSAVARARRLFQLLLFLPHAVPGVIAALIWAYLYTPSISPIVSVLSSGGIEINFFSTTMILPSIVNIGVWEWTGYNVIILFTALQAIDKQFVEAATIDGASGLRIARSIKLPMIRPAFGLIMLFTVIGTLQLFNEPTILRTSTTAVSSTFVPNMWAYDAAFNRHDLGSAAAASIVIALLAGGLSWLVTRLNSRKATS